MAGQPVPPILTEAFALNAPACSPAAPVPGGKTVPFPTVSKIGVINGAASLPDGFPPLTMLSSGGTPPFGCDMNGILYVLSAMLAALGAGQLPLFNATLAAAMGGYAKGAVLAKLDGSGLWMNMTPGNNTNPDTGGAGWIDWEPSGSDYMSATVPSGTTHDYNPPGFSGSIAFLDVDTSAGAATIGSLPQGINGQMVTVTPIGANSLKLTNNDGSATQPKFRAATAAGGQTLLQGQSCNVRYSGTLNLWLVVP